MEHPRTRAKERHLQVCSCIEAVFLCNKEVDRLKQLSYNNDSVEGCGLAGEGSSIPEGGTVMDVARAVAREFGVPYGNEVERLVAAISGSAARTP